MIEILKAYLIPVISFALTVGIIYGIFKTRLNYLEKRVNKQNGQIDCIEGELQKVNKKLAKMEVYLRLICQKLDISINKMDNE